MTDQTTVFGNQNIDTAQLIFKVYRDYHHGYWCVEVGVHGTGHTLRSNCNTKTEAIQVITNFLTSTRVEIIDET